jgi:hypothetical protein
MPADCQVRVHCSREHPAALHVLANELGVEIEPPE